MREGNVMTRFLLILTAFASLNAFASEKAAEIKRVPAQAASSTVQISNELYEVQQGKDMGRETVAQMEAFCAKGDIVISGGCNLSGKGYALTGSLPLQNYAGLPTFLCVARFVGPDTPSETVVLESRAICKKSSAR